MKRSEMHKILLDTIEGTYSWDGPRCRISFVYAHYIAENVLKLIEEEGMLPPKTNYMCSDTMDKLYPDQDWKGSDLPRKDHIWEPEDDE